MSGPTRVDICEIAEDPLPAMQIIGLASIALMSTVVVACWRTPRSFATTVLITGAYGVAGVLLSASLITAFGVNAVALGRLSFASGWSVFYAVPGFAIFLAWHGLTMLGIADLSRGAGGNRA